MKSKYLVNKKGSQMVEAAIALPIIILSVFLLIRLFTFYLEILTAGISEHEQALKLWNSNKGSTMKVYEKDREVVMLKGGMLSFDLKKKIATKVYLFNEDELARRAVGTK